MERGGHDGLGEEEEIDHDEVASLARSVSERLREVCLLLCVCHFHLLLNVILLLFRLFHVSNRSDGNEGAVANVAGEHDGRIVRRNEWLSSDRSG